MTKIVRDLDEMKEDRTTTRLGCVSNPISDLSPLIDNDMLVHLVLKGCDVSDVSPLRTLINLKFLNLACNPIENVSVFGEMHLITLDLSFCIISDMSFVRHHPTLMSLTLHDNNISDISSLIGNTTLTDLELSDNNIRSIEPLLGNTSLTRLDIYSNNIRSIKPLCGCTSLTSLDASSNPIEDVGCLWGMTHLNRIDVGGTNSRLGDDLLIERMATLNAYNHHKRFTSLKTIAYNTMYNTTSSYTSRIANFPDFSSSTSW